MYKHVILKTLPPSLETKEHKEKRATQIKNIIRAIVAAAGGTITAQSIAHMPNGVVLTWQNGKTYDSLRFNCYRVKGPVWTRIKRTPEVVIMCEVIEDYDYELHAETLVECKTQKQESVNCNL